MAGWLALATPVEGAAAEVIPGPPLAAGATSDRAGAFCPLPASAGWSEAGFAAAIAAIAIAARRRGGDA